MHVCKPLRNNAKCIKTNNINQQNLRNNCSKKSIKKLCKYTTAKENTSEYIIGKTKMQQKIKPKIL